MNAVTVRDVEIFFKEFKRMLEDDEMGYLVAKIEPGRHPWTWKERKPGDGLEDKYRFLRYVEKLEGIEIHQGQVHN